jgi:hypothetical protein
MRTAVPAVEYTGKQEEEGLEEEEEVDEEEGTESTAGLSGTVTLWSPDRKSKCAEDGRADAGDN